MTSFADRHIGTTADAQRAMLDAIGIAYGADERPVDALMREAVPASIR